VTRIQVKACFSGANLIYYMYIRQLLLYSCCPRAIQQTFLHNRAKQEITQAVLAFDEEDAAHPLGTGSAPMLSVHGAGAPR